MPKFRKKPVVVEAIQWDGSEIAWNAIQSMGCNPDQTEGMVGAINITSREGVMKADPFDYIIRGVKGEFYPCKPDIFEATYDLVEE